MDVRLVATTNRDLKGQVDVGRFRSDLYYRLNVVPIRTPSLRERPDDIPRLVQHFIHRSADNLGTPVPTSGRLSFDAGRSIAPLYDLDELERQAIERALVATSGNRTKAAKLLGISERTLRNKLNAPRPRS